MTSITVDFTGVGVIGIGVMGGLLAAAADAAQLMPPVMGIVAFVMAEYLHVPYITICLAAFVPGLFYYISLFLSSHPEANRQGLRPPADSMWVLGEVM